MFGDFCKFFFGGGKHKCRHTYVGLYTSFVSISQKYIWHYKHTTLAPPFTVKAEAQRWPIKVDNDMCYLARSRRKVSNIFLLQNACFWKYILIIFELWSYSNKSDFGILEPITLTTNIKASSSKTGGRCYTWKYFSILGWLFTPFLSAF